MGYEHIEVELKQHSRYEGAPCGDYFIAKKTEAHTTLILCDGKGHGIKANVAATMYANFLMKLLESNYSLRAACKKLIEIMRYSTNKANIPYAVFTVARILNDGVTTILSYNMPVPIFISTKKAKIMTQRNVENIAGAELKETNCYLRNNDGIMLVSDGVTQAGIGRGYAFGWGSEKLSEFVSKKLENNIKYTDLPNEIYEEIRKTCQQNNDDDISIAIAHAREGSIATVFTGPPSKQEDDSKYVREFLLTSGKKIICGGTTAGVVAKNLGREINVKMTSPSPFTPPSYEIQGIDLVTEGAISLNQFYNIIDADRNLMEEDNPVTQIYDLLMQADKIIFYIGSANTSEETDISFIQRGIKRRQEIVPLIAEKMRELGKIVVIEWI